MAVQRITIAKFGGNAGKAVFEQAHRWAVQRLDKEDSLWSTGKWRKKIEQEISRFPAWVRSRALEPEMLYYSEYIDKWSVGTCLFHGYLPESDANRKVIVCSAPILVIYPLPDHGVLQRFLQNVLRRKIIRTRRNFEARWFVLNLLEAVYAFDKLIPSASLVLIRESYTGSPDDNQITAACARSFVHCVPLG